MKPERRGGKRRYESIKLQKEEKQKGKNDQTGSNSITHQKKQKKNEMEKEKTRFTKERKEAAKNTEGSNAVNNHRD